METNHNQIAYYQTQCNDRGVRIYPINDYGKYLLVIEFSKSPRFESFAQQSLVRGDTRYDPKGNEWFEKIHAKYKQIFESRIKPRLDQGKEVKPGTIRPLYNRAG